ncbi:MAG: hypothetical protein ACXAD7_06785, partial [Candidatus Kariarchaeaceae archaeon]
MSTTGTLAYDTSKWKTGIGEGASLTQKIVYQSVVNYVDPLSLPSELRYGYYAPYHTMLYPIDGEETKIIIAETVTITYEIESIKESEILYTITFEGNITFEDSFGSITPKEVVTLDQQVIPRDDIQFFCRDLMFHPIMTTNLDFFKQVLGSDPRGFEIAISDKEFSTYVFISTDFGIAHYPFKEFNATYDKETGFIKYGELKYYNGFSGPELWTHVQVETIDFNKGSQDNGLGITGIEVMMISSFMLIA